MTEERRRGEERKGERNRGRRRKSGGRKLARNSNFRSHFSSSINSYLYATPCFLSIRVCARALDFAGGVFPRDIAGICQSILRRTSERARNSAKLASRLWKLMSRAVHVLVTASPVSSLIFAASRRGMYAVSIIYKHRAVILPILYSALRSIVRTIVIFYHIENSYRIVYPTSGFLNPFHLALPFLERREYLMALTLE